MKYLYILLIPLLLAACSGKKTTAADDIPAPAGPEFSADSAMAYCRAQCDFGPRTMNSAAHERCCQWIAGKFRSFGLDVQLQKATLTAWDGTALAATNIIANLNPKATRRIMLCAHWDSRPWADNDPDSANWRKPVMAANDGASGVAVMLEVARLAKAAADSLAIGIDFVCFDAEDYGIPQWSDRPDDESTWALGAAHWAANPHKAGYTAECGVLLDMVGGQGAKFYKEGFSQQYAGETIYKVWQAARAAGYGSTFIDEEGGTVVDDHVSVNRIAGIPTIDIIAYYPDCAQSSFGPTWHTTSDDIDHIDQASLKAVGQTLIQFIFTE